MDDTKAWWQSRTIWALVVSVVSTVASALGKQIDPALQGSLTDFIMQGITVISAVVAAIFRVKATTTIGTPTP